MSGLAAAPAIFLKNAKDISIECNKPSWISDLGDHPPSFIAKNCVRGQRGFDSPEGIFRSHTIPLLLFTSLLFVGIERILYRVGG
jgi:hypothetical protein